MHQNLLISVMLLLFFNNICFSQIIYTDVEPDSLISVIELPGSSGYYYINLDNDNMSDFSFQHFVPDSNNFKTIEMRFWGEDHSAQPYGEVLLNSSQYPSKLAENSKIDSSSGFKWGNGTNSSSNCQWVVNRSQTSNWKSGDEGYLALRIQKNNHWHYGWLKMKVLNNVRGFIIMEYAWNSKADEPINAGQKTTTDVTDELPATNNYALYPNPATDYITINIKPSEGLAVEIYDILGVKMQTTPITSTSLSNWVVNFKIDVSHLPVGLYLVKIGNRVEKFVKM